MMQQGTAALCVALAIACPACYSAVPIDQSPQAELDKALLGTWRCLPSDPRPDTYPANFVVDIARPGVYSIRLVVEDEDPLPLEGHFSLVNGHPILNVRDLDPKGPSKPWLFARYSYPLANVLRVQVVEEDVFNDVAETPVAYRHVLEQLPSDSPKYADYVVCIRTRPDGSAWN